MFNDLEVGEVDPDDVAEQPTDAPHVMIWFFFFFVFSFFVDSTHL